MAWTEQLPNGNWRACWRDQQGKRKSSTGRPGKFVRKAEAARYAGEQESIARKGGNSYRGRSITWGAWSIDWLAVRSIEASSADAELARIGRWVEPKWGSVPLVKITRHDVQAWVGYLGLHMAAGSVIKVARILSKSLNDAVAAGHLQVNPCVGVKLPTPAPGAERYLTRAEVDLALYHLGEPYRTAVILLVGCGLRFGELAGLHWQRVDLGAGVLDVVESYTSAGGMIKAYPKGRKMRRVPVPSWVAEAIIARQPAAMGNSCGLAHARGSRCESGLVLPAVEGGALNARFVRAKHWVPALQRAGIAHTRQHDLRHTYASWLLQGGASLSEVAEVMGHSSITVTQRYAHLAPSYSDRVRAILESAA